MSDQDWKAEATREITTLRQKLKEAERERDEAREYGRQARLREKAAEDARISAVDRATALAEKNARLREALEQIEYLDRPQIRGLPRRVSISEIARSALDDGQGGETA